MPQRQKTDPIEDGDDLPDLTDQQRHFVEGILAGKSASDAYRAAYDCSNMLPNSIWCEASKLRHHANIAQWLAAARMANLGTAKVTLEGHLQELERLKEIAIKTGNVGAAVQAEQLRGKAVGHYIERIADVTRDVDPAHTLREIAKISPEAAQALAAQHGIDMDSAPGATKH